MPKAMEANSKCSLHDMLASRDRRSEWQRLHFKDNPATTLMVATVVAPGEYKLTPDTEVVAKAMEEVLIREFRPYIIASKHYSFVSGHEVWLKLSCTESEAKRMAVKIEDTYILGRLFDIDVIRPDMQPLSRREIGKNPRKCLLCDNEARLCMRLRKHDKEEISTFITDLIERYVSTSGQYGNQAT